MAEPTSTLKPRKRFVGNNSSTALHSGPRATLSHQVPDEILHDAHLNDAIKQFPTNYSFEIHKTIHQIRKHKAIVVGLQMPEGLQMFACAIADLIEQFTNAFAVILGDTTYGACCVDDYTALALGCDMLIHYGHSCLVPIDQMRIKTLYVFVEISIDSVHLEKTIRLNLPNNRQRFHEMLLRRGEDAHLPAGSQLGHLRIENSDEIKQSVAPVDLANSEPTRLALVSTIQFVTALQRLKEGLTANGITVNDDSVDPIPANAERLIRGNGKYDVMIPQSKPLSPGEILGCTAPRLSNVDAILYLGDGRFHLESIMVANPAVPAFQYDPYAKKLTVERYDHLEMQTTRHGALESAKADIYLSKLSGGKTRPIWGVILGTLGRQGNFQQLEAITKHLESARTAIPYIPILLSEISPAKLSLFNPYISTFVQTSCPRLSVDWGYAFNRPLLSPYEAAVAIGVADSWMNADRKEIGYYPMDFYAGGSPWAMARLTASL